MLSKWKAHGEKHALPSPTLPPKTQTNSDRFVKAIGQRLEHHFVLNLFHVKDVADQEAVLHKRRGCSTVSAIHMGMHVQPMLYTIREH